MKKRDDYKLLLSAKTFLNIKLGPDSSLGIQPF